ncbi:MAG: hypothetical protein QM765_32200 [Myxococcales bacterium]
MSALVRYSAAFAAAITLFGCSKTAPWESKPITDGLSYFDAYHLAFCKWADRCDLLSAASKERCPEAMKEMVSGLISSATTLSVQTGAQAFDLEAAKACVASIEEAACVNGFPRPVEACSKVFKAARQDGETCYQNADCLSGDCELSGCTGVCLPLSKVGESCGTYHHRCDPALPMAGCCLAPGATTGTCAEVAKVGEPCSESPDACHFCDPHTAACFGGRCVALGTDGDSCDQKTTPGCAAGLYCTWETGASVCRRQGLQGETCSSSQQTCAVGFTCLESTHSCQPSQRKIGESCELGQYCQDDGKCVDGVCKAAALKTYGDVGASCSAGCKLFLTCDDGFKCAEFPKEGDACHYGSDIQPQCAVGLLCASSNTCVKPSSVGATCSWGAQCESSRCVDGKCAEACQP